MTWTHDSQQMVTILPGDPVCQLPASGLGHAMGAYTGIVNRQIPYDVAYYCIDPCTQIIHDSQVNHQNSMSEADRKERARRRAAKRAMEE